MNVAKNHVPDWAFAVVTVVLGAAVAVMIGLYMKEKQEGDSDVIKHNAAMAKCGVTVAQCNGDVSQCNTNVDKLESSYARVYPNACSGVQGSEGFSTLAGVRGNAKVKGSVVGYYPTADLEACMAACAKNDTCHSLNFHTDTKVCQMMNETAGPRGNVNPKVLYYVKNPNF
jgi:hypothetical protein